MSFLNMLKSGSSVKSQPLQIRKEVVTAKSSTPRPPPKPVVKRPDEDHPRQKDGGRKSDRPASPKSATRRSQLSRKRHTSSQPSMGFSSEDNESDDLLEAPKKKLKHEMDYEIDPNRQVRCRKAFSEDDGGDFPMVHAADITSLDKSVKYVPLFQDLTEAAEIVLQYPSASQRERYLLVKPKFGDDDFKAIEDITQVMHKVVECYVPESEREAFDNESTGFPQRLGRAVSRKSESEVREILNEWNDSIVQLRKKGVLSEVMDKWKSVDAKLVERILSQACARTVSLQVKSLGQYKNGTDNVYGELLPRFVSDILRKDTRIKSDQVFIDLGSGVGNVVLQAALEVGCESWGCEMMNNYCDLADLQQAEFQARCRLWGLAAGEIHLERGDFLTNAALAKVLPRADVVLVNNQVFTPELNERLTSLFLDLKEGCLVVSLKSFVPSGHKITARNLNSPYNVLDVKQKEYYSGCVSWTNAPGKYYVSRKDTRKIKAFAARN